jgi:hypothetical protein
MQTRPACAPSTIASLMQLQTHSTQRKDFRYIITAREGGGCILNSSLRHTDSANYCSSAGKALSSGRLLPMLFNGGHGEGPASCRSLTLLAEWLCHLRKFQPDWQGSEGMFGSVVSYAGGGQFDISCGAATLLIPKFHSCVPAWRYAPKA